MPFSNPITAGTILVQPAIQSPNFNQAGHTGWAIKADGSAYFFNITATGTITGTTVVVQGSAGGIFVYSGVATLGNLVGSVTGAVGTDSNGNAYLAGNTSYKNLGGGAMVACSVQSGQISFQSAAAPGGPYSSSTSIEGSGSNPEIQANGSLTVNGLSTGIAALVVGNLASLGIGIPLAIFTGTSSTGTAVLVNGPGPGQVEIDGAGDISAATLALAASVGTGGLLTLTNSSLATGNPNVQLTGFGSTDNMLGIEISGDSNNRYKLNASGKMQWGSGSAGQDTSLYRTAAGGQLGADTILANVSGSAETWHTLGTLAGATVNVGQFRFLADGMVAMEIDLTFAVATAVPINFSVTIPAAYRPLGSVDVRAPMAQTNAAGGIGRIFVGSASGGNPGLVQITSLGGGNVIGTYSAHFQYPVI